MQANHDNLWSLPSPRCAQLLIAGLMAVSGCDRAADDEPGAPPEPYSAMLVYVADGAWDPALVDEDTLSLERTQREVWGLEDADIDAFESEVRGFYSQRFGLDVDDPEAGERFVITTYGCDPRLAYRVVVMSEREVPPAGWPVCDGGYLLTIIDPEGVQLGGEFEGQVAPPGASMAFGRYHIETDTGEVLSIGFRSLTPYVSDPWGNASIRCELDSPELGTGVANLVYRLDQLESGEFTLMIRNVLTFD